MQLEIQKKAVRIMQQLDTLYPEPPIPLHYEDAFTLLIAVLLSAQCTDARVNKVTPGLFALAKTPQTMKQLSIDTIREAIRSCGLAPTKARHIHRLSHQLDEQFAGKVPDTFDELMTLPGVGRKTAQVVMAQAFKIPAFPIDTHIFRLSHRWGLSQSKRVIGVERDLKALFPKSSWNKLHLQLIYFGREYCPAKKHEPKNCPICSWAMKEEIR